MTRILRRATFAVTALSVLVASADARAWYFPEHIVIAKDAASQLPPDLRDVLSKAVERARAEGLPLCPRVDVGLEDLRRSKPLQTRMLRADLGVECIPFAALPAIAADHSDGAKELRTVLGSNKGLELTTAAAYEWDRFTKAVARLPGEPIERMSFVHELDVDFYFIDPGYELRAQASRAHFVDAGRTIAEVVRAAGAAGAVDNAIGQFLAHHLRSLGLAAHGQASEALLEHGLAVHFLEDAFSAGHLVMTDRTWERGNTHARQRHDFFDAKGLYVRRALSAEPCAALEHSFEGGLPPCWSTTGDGYLGMTPDASDRLHVARAVKKAQLELAIALDPARVVAIVEALPDRERIAIGELVDPMPWWTLRPGSRQRRPSSTEHALALVRGAATAALRLREGALTPVVDVGTRTGGPLFGEQVARFAIDPCAPRDEALGEEEEEDGCGPEHVLALGTVGASLLRPLLVELPASERDVSELHGEATTDHGLAFQLMASASAGALLPQDAPIDFFAPSVGVSMGVAYRFGTYLPGRRNRSGIELNAGISTALHVDGRGRAGGNPQVTMLEQELRWPILWEALTSYVLPLDLRKSKEAGSVILLGGVRVKEMLTDPTPRFWGIEVEAAAFALGSGRGAYPLYSASPEIRIYVGAADPSAAQPSFPSTWGPTIGLTLTGGYATFL